jgi:hypothetical protein
MEDEDEYDDDYEDSDTVESHKRTKKVMSHGRIKKANKAKSKAHEMATLKQPTSGIKINQDRVLSINRKMNRGNSLSNDSTLFSKSKQGKKGVYSAKMKTYRFHKK